MGSRLVRGTRVLRGPSDAPAPGAITREEQAYRTRSAILGAAAELFAERGYAATSLQMIANRVGLTKAAVYHHFSTKEAILLSVADPLLDEVAAVLDTAATFDDLDERISAMAAGLVDVLVAHRGLLTALTADPVLQQIRELRARADYVARVPKLTDRALRLLYRDPPTVLQRAAMASTGYLGDVIEAIPDATDEQLHDALTMLCITLLRLGLRDGPAVNEAPRTRDRSTTED